MSIEEFNKKIDVMIAEFQNPANNLPENIMLMLALDTKAMIERRVVGTGKDATGKSFSPYSKKYAEKRKATGKQTAIKSFLYDHTMWPDVKPTPVRREGAIISIMLGPQRPKEREKMLTNTTRENARGNGDIMDVSKQEEKVLLNTLNRLLGSYLKEL